MKIVKRTMSSFTVNMNQRPIIMTILMLVAINLVFLVIASVIAMLVSPGTYDNFVLAFVDVASFLIVPASVANIENDPALMVLGMVVIVVGMLLFTGTIIALATNLLRSYLTQKGKAQGKLNISGHFVILRYNAEVPGILINLMHSCNRKTVLILSDKDRDYVRAELLTALANLVEKPKGNIRLIVRQGDPASLNELEEIGLESASGLLILNDRQSSDDELCQADITGAIQLVLNLANFDFVKNFPIGVETCTQEAAEVIKAMQKDIDGLQNKNIQFFSHNVKLGQFLAITVVRPNLAKELKKSLSKAGRAPISPNVPNADATTIPKKLFVIGENKKHRYFLEALKTANMQIKHFKTIQVDDFVAELKRNGDKDTVAVILSDDNVAAESYDANVFLALIELSRQCGIHQRKFKIVAELLNPNNQKSLSKFNVQDIIVSTEIISLFASTVLTDIEAERACEEMFSVELFKNNS